ncbi:MAG: 6-phosphofructokinase [Anaerovoracaceae bacterium]
MKKIGVLTSGGDAPGMNAAIRAIVRTALYNGLDVVGIEHGYEGLLNEAFIKMDQASVGDIIQRGGTILKTARSKRFMTQEGQRLAADNLRNQRIEGLVVCGGDGTFNGAMKLSEHGIRVIGVPCTIDNDMAYTEFTIGFDTAINTVIDSIGKIRDTSSSHERTSIVEVMGRDCGDIAIYAGIACGADAILIPELPVDLDQICKNILSGVKRGKTHTIIIKSEGVDICINDLSRFIEESTHQEVRSTVLSQTQRGGSPSARDRILASEMGYRAVQLLLTGKSDLAVGINGSRITEIPLQEAVAFHSDVQDFQMLSLIEILSR